MEEKQRQSYRHRTPVQLRFSDVDRFGHVNNAVMFSIYDMAKTEYFNSVLRELTKGDTLAVADICNDASAALAHSVNLRDLNADFIHPVFYGDKIEIHTAVARMGTKSVTVTQQAVNTKTGSVVSTCRTTLVCFSAAKNDSIPVPPEIRKRITEYEDNIIL